MHNLANGTGARSTTVEVVGLGSAALASVGRQGARRTVEFLTARVQNPNTRRAYTRAIRDFAGWCVASGIDLPSLESPQVATYVEELGERLSPPSVKLHLAGIKHWLDWLVTGHVIATNPAHAVRGPRYTQQQGKTPVLELEQARALLEGIDTSHLVGLRDRALISVMLFAFARVGAVVKMRVRDFEHPATPKAAFRLHEKGGKFHRVPAHHRAAEAVEAYLEAAKLERPKTPLFQSTRGRSRQLTGRALSENDALRMIKRRCLDAGLPDAFCNHSMRASGITFHQDAGGELEAARQIAGHANVKTTQLYNRSGDKRRKSEVERVQL
jgi:site-specific recombinase XerD